MDLFKFCTNDYFPFPLIGIDLIILIGQEFHKRKQQILSSLFKIFILYDTNSNIQVKFKYLLNTVHSRKKMLFFANTICPLYPVSNVKCIYRKTVKCRAFHVCSTHAIRLEINKIRKSMQTMEKKG